MAIATYFLATLVLCQILAGFARPQVPDITTTSTTTLSPVFADCFSLCQTQVTSQYNPVCGTNGLNYNNIDRLRCAQRCGISVQLSHRGTCGPSPGGK